MKSDRVMVWKFDSAPAELQTLHAGGVTPHWIALVPAGLHGADLHKAILTQTGLTGVSMQPTTDGDVVYFGSSDPLQFIEILEAATRVSGSRLST